MIAWIVTGVGIVLTAVAAWLDPSATAFAWTAAFAWGASLVVGALVLVLLAPVAPIRWISGLLPGIRALADNTTLLVALFVPVALAVPRLYGWADPATLEPSARHLVEARGLWQTPGFFLVRAGVYLAVWVAVSRLAARPRGSLSGASLVGVDRSGASLLGPIAGLIAVGVTWTLASVDWLMSLEAQWTSSVYGVYTFAGGFAAALAATVLLARAGERRERTPRLPPDLYHALGRLLFAFVCFWAYVFWAQFLIVWLGGIPEEARHLVVRLEGWPAWLVVLLVAHFALPFVLLLGRAPKRSPAFLAGVSMLVLVAHALDMIWLVLPAHWPTDPLFAPAQPVLLVLAVLVGPFLTVAGVLAVATRARLASAPAVPAPLVAPTLAYRSP